MKKLSDEKRNQAIHLLRTTSLPCRAICEFIGCSRSTVVNIGIAEFTADEWNERTVRTKARGEAHGKYTAGTHVDANGYRQVSTPEWFRSTRYYVPEQHVVYCQANNLTCVPEGYCIHHIDEDKLNNDIDNLQMMTLGEHVSLHHKGKSKMTKYVRDVGEWME